MKRTNQAARIPACRPLCAGIASLLALSAPIAFAAPSVWQVTSCDDAGAGSLRDVIGAGTTLSGDTVDLSGLTKCTDSTISLSTGEILIKQDDLTILGPGKAALTVDGTKLPGGSTNFADSRLFTHNGNGTLTLTDLSLANGHVYHTGNGYPARGGCIYSSKHVILQSSDVIGCSAYSGADQASGGGIFTKGNLTLQKSTVTKNSALGSGQTQGGGAASEGSITVIDSVISANTANSSPQFVRGGGLYAFGSATLTHSQLAGNAATAYTSFAEGGGIYTRGNLTLAYATLTGNTTTTTNNGTCGGGAASFGNIGATYSTIDGNYAGGQPQATSGGGMCLLGNFTMFRSTVSGNITTGQAGAIQKSNNCVGCNWTLLLRDSTVSGNQANLSGGIYSAATHTKLYNSTIAFNTATLSKVGVPGSYFYESPGMTISAFNEPVDVTIHSMIISNNSYGAGVENDFGVVAIKPVTFNAGPAHSLIRVSDVAGLPTGIMSGACPLLGPLRDNGGLTKTHALQSTSPAIDSGDNLPIGFATLDVYDQRGSALANGELDYLRVSGPIGDPVPLPDIGAYEVQQDDVIFNAGHEGCAELP